MAVADAQVLANRVDGTILVVRKDHTEKAAIKDTITQLRHVNGTLIGSVFNDVVLDGVGYYGYGYY